MNSNGDIQLHSQHCNPLQAVDHDVTRKNPKIFLHSPDQRPASLKKPQNVAFRPANPALPASTHRHRFTTSDSPPQPFCRRGQKNTQTLPGLTPALRFVLRVRTTPPAFARQFSAPPHPHPLIRAHARPFVVPPHSLHSCPFVSIRGSSPPPSFVPIRVHSWFNPTPSFVPIRVHSWFNPPLHSCPFVFIRGSTPPLHSCRFVSLRGSTPLPSFVSIRGSNPSPLIPRHSWFKTLPAPCEFHRRNSQAFYSKV